MPEVKAAEIARQYAAAHRLHHVAASLPGALQLYIALIGAHANAPEAGYARSQIQHMLREVVPAQELLDAHVALLQLCFERERSAAVSTDETP